MRDTRKPKEYFDKWVLYNEERIASMASAISGFPTPLQSRHVTYLYNYANKHLQLMISRYSRGDAICELGDLALSSINAFEKFADALDAIEDSRSAFPVDLDRVHHNIWLITFIYSTHGVGYELKRVADVINRVGKDRLSDSILNGFEVLPSEGNNELYCHKMHKKLLTLFSKKEPDSESICAYLDSWYPSCSGAYWYETHLEEDTGYFGYYCFELLMLMKARSIDISDSIIEHPYFPSILF